jgi:polysaccharide biosynthesis protein PslH
MRLRILFLSAFFPSPSADSAGVLDVYHIIKELAKRHDITLLSFATNNDLKYLPHLKQICHEVITVRSPALPGTFNAYLFTGISLFSPYPAIALMTQSREMKNILIKKLSENNFDLIQVEFTQMAHYIDQIKIISNNIPVVIDESDIAFIRRSRFAETRCLIKRLLLRWDSEKLKHYELSYCGKFDAVLVRTEKDLQILKSYLPNKIFHKLPPWIDTSFVIRIKKEPEEENLMFYGAMWRPVNADAVIFFVKRIFPYIIRERPDVKFLIVGSRPPKSVLKLQSDRVIVTGYVEDITPYYNKAAIVVAPLRAGSGIKGKILQALACGKPVVTTSVGAEGIDAKESDGLFIADNVYDFAQCILNLLKNKKYLEYYDRAKYYFQSHYNWVDGIKSLEDLYIQLLKYKRGNY